MKFSQKTCPVQCINVGYRQTCPVQGLNVKYREDLSCTQCINVKYREDLSREGIQERTLTLRFLGIISRVLRLEVSTLAFCLSTRCY